jgi:quercetin dioxygenase-like cupin family protein
MRHIGHPILTALFSALLQAQTPQPSISIATLVTAPLGDTAEPKMALLILNLAPNVSIPSHSHRGVVFAYVLHGDIENQIEPAEPQIYHPGDFFQENANQIHRFMRNLSKTEQAKILIFQNAGNSSPLLQEPLVELSNQEVSMFKLVAAPGAASASAHKHTGPVFGYVVKGEIETQVDPAPPTHYRAGEVFYEPPMHAHRLFRNVSQTDSAEVVLFGVSEKGKPLSIGAADSAKSPVR